MKAIFRGLYWNRFLRASASEPIALSKHRLYEMQLNLNVSLSALALRFFFLYFIFNPLDGFQTIENSRICSRISNTAVRAIGAGHALKAKCRPVSTSIRITRITLNVHRPSTEYVNTTRLAHVNWFCVYGFDFRTIWLFYACLKIHWYVRFRALLVNFIRFLFVWTILHIKYSTGNKFWFINFFTMKYESKKRFYDCI